MLNFEDINISFNFLTKKLHYSQKKFIDGNTYNKKDAV